LIGQEKRKGKPSIFWAIPDALAGLRPREPRSITPRDGEPKETAKPVGAKIVEIPNESAKPIANESAPYFYARCPNCSHFVDVEESRLTGPVRRHLGRRTVRGRAGRIVSVIAQDPSVKDKKGNKLVDEAPRISRPAQLDHAVYPLGVVGDRSLPGIDGQADHGVDGDLERVLEVADPLEELDGVEIDDVHLGHRLLRL
jgi:hypothetical protein